MKRFMQITRDKVKEGDAGGAADPKKEEAAPAKTSEKNDAPAQAAGPKFDDLGYEISEKATEEKPVEKAAEAPKKEVEVKDKVTGYAEEPKVVEAAPAKEPEKKVEDPKKEEELKLDAEGLPDDEVARVKEFAKKHGVTKEVAQALVDQKKQDRKDVEEYVKAQKVEAEANMHRTRKQWYDELKADPAFGGDKFAYNVMQAEKVVEEHMPNLKKKLAESKTMLPSYVMKDLAKLANHLYSTEKLTQGDPIVETKPKDDTDDYLAFYN